MAKVFKQKSNLIQAISFAGLIIVSQLFVLNMGYSVPLYFLVPLIVFCVIIVWGMVDVRCIIEGNVLKSKVGPFVQKIASEDINSIKVKRLKRGLRRKEVTEFEITFNENKRLQFVPSDVDGFLKAIVQLNPQIQVLTID